MAHVGDVIEHPLTGERVTFLETAGSTGGKFLRVRLDVRPGGAIPNVHVHPGRKNSSQSQRGVCRFEGQSRLGWRKLAKQ